MRLKIQDVFINWHGLVKNRQGPYHLVVKNETGHYFSAYSYDRRMAGANLYECTFSDCNLFWFQRTGSKQHSAYLTTAAGDIKITKEDFNSEITFIE
jgi:hypothetical protein